MRSLIRLILESPWNAIRSRVEQLDLGMTDAQRKECTAKIKQLAEVRSSNVDGVYGFPFLSSLFSLCLYFDRKYSDSIVRRYRFNIQTSNNQPLLKGIDHSAPGTQGAAGTSEPAAKKLRTQLDQDAAKCC